MLECPKIDFLIVLDIITQTETKKVENKPLSPDKEITPEAKAWVREIMEVPKMKEFEAR